MGHKNFVFAPEIHSPVCTKSAVRYSHYMYTYTSVSCLLSAMETEKPERQFYNVRQWAALSCILRQEVPVSTLNLEAHSIY